MADLHALPWDADTLIELIAALRRDYRAVVAERNRLQAVVDVARALLANGDDVFHYEAARADLTAALDQLDTTGDIGGEGEA